MTGPEYIATAIGLIAAAMIWAFQHGLGTRTTQSPPDPPDGEPP